MASALVLIYSTEHDAWWRPGFHGYTQCRYEAGLYERAEAQRIVDGTRGRNERIEEMVPEDLLYRGASSLLEACRAALPYIERTGHVTGDPARRAAVLAQVRLAIADACIDARAARAPGVASP